MISLDALYQLSRQYLENKYKNYQRLDLSEKIFKSRLSILMGQRGIGKTTLIVQYLLTCVLNDVLSREILYVPADHFLLGSSSLYDIAEYFYQNGGKIIAFDEIHKYPAWSLELKSIYDTFPTLKIIASGSSALEIHKGSHDLTRRAIVSSIVGLSFREYLELDTGLILPRYSLDEVLCNHEKTSAALVKKLNRKKILAEFKRYLRVGYYPYFLEVADEELYFITLEQNFHTTIESDLPAIYPALTGSSIYKMKRLLAFIASAVPFTPNFKKLKTLLDIGDERTLKTYFKYLEDAGLIHQVAKASQKLHQLEAPEKIYLNNTNQLFAIAPMTQQLGTVRELFFLTMLSHAHEVSVPKCGDFLIDHKILFEIGGRKKTFAQIKDHDQKNTYLACDEIEMGIRNKIPLWLFGFLY